MLLARSQPMKRWYDRENETHAEGWDEGEMMPEVKPAGTGQAGTNLFIYLSV